MSAPPLATPVAPPRASLSPSRAADFMTCPLLYRFRVVDRLSEPPSPAAVRGTLVHRILEDLHGLPAAERTLATAVTMVGPTWTAMSEQDPRLASMFRSDEASTGDAVDDSGSSDDSSDDSSDGSSDDSSDDTDGGVGERITDWLGTAETLLMTYFILEDPTRVHSRDRELAMHVELDDGIVLRGIIDRVDTDASGALRVVDYKTGRSPSPDFEARALFQMRFYALALWRATGVAPKLLQLLYLGNAERLSYEPDEADLLATERKVRALVAAIVRAHDSGDWRPRPSKLCAWCAHQALCPEFGGTPPPLPVVVDPLPPAAAAEGDALGLG